MLPALVAAGRLSSLERGDEPFGHVASSLPVLTRHLAHDILAGEDVSLDGEPVSELMAGPRVAFAAGVGSHGTGGGHDAELPRLAALVRRERLLERGRRIDALRQQAEHARTVGGNARRLRGDCPDAGLRPRHHRANREVLRVDRDPDLTRRGVGRDDRERRGPTSHQG